MLEISLVFDRSNKHTKLYDNVELTAKYIKSVKLSNFTKIYSLTNEKNYDMDNLTQKYLLYKQFVFWCCNGCSTAHLIDCMSKTSTKRGGFLPVEVILRFLAGPLVSAVAQPNF